MVILYYSLCRFHPFPCVFVFVRAFVSVSISAKVFYTFSLQQILIRTDRLLHSGTILETLKHTDHDTINTLMGKIKQLMTDFDDRLGKRKKKIDESVQLHKLTEMVRQPSLLCATQFRGK